jgi:hypothetical protein
VSMRRLASVLWVLALAGGGCSSDPTRGYALSPSHDRSVRTVSVPIFGNESYSSGLEVRLTRAIISEIQRSTPWRVVGPEHAATTLEGAIEGVDLQELTIRREVGLVQEQALRVTVRFDWVDNRTGLSRVSRRGFTGVTTFVPARGVGEPLEVAEDALVGQLARDIVAELRSDW